MDSLDFVALRHSKVIFLCLKGNHNSRTKNYFHGLTKKAVPAFWYDCSKRQLLSLFFGGERRFLKKSGVRIVVASPSHVLSILVFLFLQKRPILDAGWPLFDGVVTSRREFGFLGLNVLKTYLVDFLSFHCSSTVIVESDYQRRRVSSLFLLPRQRICVVETGFDENRINHVKSFADLTDINTFRVLFRGGNQKEAGLGVLIAAINKGRIRNKDICFHIITNTNGDYVRENSRVEWVSRKVTDEELFEKYLSADLALGQLSKHKRLQWTIPHKFYEAAFFGLPYLTSNSLLMSEFSNEGFVFVFEAGDSSDLIAKIEMLSENKALRIKAGLDLKDFYQKNLSQKVLSEKFFEVLH